MIQGKVKNCPESHFISTETVWKCMQNKDSSKERLQSKLLVKQYEQTGGEQDSRRKKQLLLFQSLNFFFWELEPILISRSHRKSDIWWASDLKNSDA